jgi:hypothetical protein
MQVAHMCVELEVYAAGACWEKVCGAPAAAVKRGALFLVRRQLSQVRLLARLLNCDTIDRN